jgi:hypothetical protein
MAEKKEVNLRMPDRIMARLARVSILAEQPIEVVINVLLAAVVDDSGTIGIKPVADTPEQG